MPLPQRPATYILLLLVTVLAALTLWLFRTVTAPELRQAIRQKQAESSQMPEKSKF